MLQSFWQWLRILGAWAGMGALACLLYAVPAVAMETDAGPGKRHQVRMKVDFTVLPKVLPDGTEAPLPTDPDAIQGESSLPPESAVTPSPPAVAAPNASETVVPPAPAPEPESGQSDAPANAAPEAVAASPDSTPPAPAATGPGTVKSVRLKADAQGFTITVQADKPLGETSFFNLNEPRRLVVDLHDGWKLTMRNVVHAKGRLKHMVIGEHPDRLRLVVHFNTPPKGKLTPVFTRAGNTLKIRADYP